MDAYARGVNEASGADVRRVISRVYPAGSDLTLVLIGNAETVREVAGKYGEVTEMSITDKWFSPVP